ncbi:MAG: iron-sulfur cluster assembly scaffold protein [Chloroflexi bacterium]|nr:iron-sulfur cluster assembly scaffold protein [Chloroflexota bacterium]
MTTKQEESGNVFSAAVIDHASNPRNARSMDDADAYASVLGPCGDNMEMWLKARDGRVKDVTFWTDGCGATIACGSMATELAKGKTLGEALAISAEVIAMKLGGLPDDHAHCAGLASLTLKKAIIEYMNLQKEPWKRAYKRQ